MGGPCCRAWGAARAAIRRVTSQAAWRAQQKQGGTVDGVDVPEGRVLQQMAWSVGEAQQCGLREG